MQRKKQKPFFNTVFIIVLFIILSLACNLYIIINADCYNNLGDYMLIPTFAVTYVPLALLANIFLKKLLSGHKIMFPVFFIILMTLAGVTAYLLTAMTIWSKTGLNCIVF